MPLALILAVGQDPTLLDTRNLILRSAGYMVEPARSIGQAISHFRAGDFDLVVVCHSVPAQDRDRLASLIRTSGSATPIVCISAMTGEQHDAFADAIIESDPRMLLCGIKEVLAKAARQYHQPSEVAKHDGSADGRTQPTILCIDDDPNLLAIRRRVLENAGYTILTALSGFDGLKVFSTGIVDAVILDYAMPIMNGGAAAAQMRQIKRGVPIILHSGHSAIPEDDLTLFSCVVPKGASPNMLILAIQEVLSDAGVQKAPAEPLKVRQTGYGSRKVQ
jgi:CheY-like chemotaxis protein